MGKDRLPGTITFGTNTDAMIGSVYLLASDWPPAIDGDLYADLAGMEQIMSSEGALAGDLFLPSVAKTLVKRGKHVVVIYNPADEGFDPKSFSLKELDS